MRILIVEDEQAIAQDIASVLHAAGFVSEISLSGEDGWYKGGTEEFDAVILDLGLPKLDGLSVLKRWRAEGQNVPVLILTALGNWDQRVEGFEAGADDYLPKPFRMEELVARLRAILRRSSGASAPKISVGSFTLDTNQMRVFNNGQPIQLTPLEYRLFSFLVHHRGQTVSKQMLNDHVYALNHERSDNSIEALVRRVRQKLGRDVIETQRGFGYLIEQKDGQG
ncbi:MAG: response regulator transcription factor [Hyphomicrobiales bacterium]|nr:response regulator transcription factor [Hyphomicrobiales bacterium]